MPDEYEDVVDAKTRYRWGRKNRRELSRSPFDATDKIVITRKDGQWVASALKKVCTGRNPEEALKGLVEKVFRGCGDISGANNTMEMLRVIDKASCDILEFHQKPDVDGQNRFVVDFVTHRQLTRPDFEYRISSNAIKCWQCKYNPNSPIEYQRQDVGYEEE